MVLNRLGEAGIRLIARQVAERLIDLNEGTPIAQQRMH